jgi:hypothetical protein
MVFDKDAVTFFKQWSKKYPSKTLDLYFSGQLQFLTNKLDLRVFKKLRNIRLHPIFLSSNLNSSFHIKAISSKKKSSFFSINFKKSKRSPNDLLLTTKNIKAHSLLKNVLLGVDRSNCSNFSRLDFFRSHFLKYEFIFNEYEDFCKGLNLKKEIRTSRFQIDMVDKDQSYTFFTHILNSHLIDQFPASQFYAARTSVKTNNHYKNVFFNSRFHYKFILDAQCFYWMTSNLTPTANSNKGELSFKVCNKKSYNKLKVILKDVAKSYKSK